MHSRATDGGSASKCQGKWPDQTLDQAFGLPEVLVAVSTSRLSCKRAGKTRTLMPVWDSSGESRFNAASVAHQAAGRSEFGILVDRGHCVAKCQCCEPFAVAGKECISSDYKRAGPQLD